jgi:hypothetical protein
VRAHARAGLASISAARPGKRPRRAPEARFLYPERGMRFLLGLAVVVFNLLDNATTFLCLRAPVAGFDVVEANPFARVLFDGLGLVPGLLFETAITTTTVAFLVFYTRLSAPVRLGLLAVLALLPAFASVNNLLVMRAVGIGMGID